jgi:hypothetical protein
MTMTKGRDQAGNGRRRRRDALVVEVDGFGIAVSQRASSSLETVGAAIAATTTPAESLSARAQEMRDASKHVTENMASASAPPPLPLAPPG